MNIEKLNIMVTAFELMAGEIKADRMSINDLKESLTEMKLQIGIALEMFVKISNDEEIEGISQLQVIALKAQIEDETMKFDMKEHKKTIVALLQVIKATDEDIGENILLPFFLDILKEISITVENIHADSAKAIRKGIKKFNKLNNTTV